ncbi:MAG: imelysin family protein [Bacteroidota bacterium]
MKKSILFIVLIVLVGFMSSCESDGPGETSDGFNRKALLENWADNIIIPAYADFTNETADLIVAGRNFQMDPSMTTLNDLRDSWLIAYKGWQRVTMFLYLKGDELLIRVNMNIYPSDTAAIQKNIKNGDYKLELSSYNDQQGFPALDYMLYGLGTNDDEILARYTTDPMAEKNRKYVADLCTRIHSLASAVNDDWNTGFRDEFVNNDGSSVNSSVNRIVNDYIFYYEKDLRLGKVGVPAGMFTNIILPRHVEAVYHGNIANTLLNESLDAAQDFFNGVHYGGTTNGVGLDDYLNHLNSMKEGEDLTLLINNQFEAARVASDVLSENFEDEVLNNFPEFQELLTALQLNIVLLKTDMLQALNINTDFIDSDGD